MPHRLSKSRFVAGMQCHKLLWWKVHEPNAVELQPDKVLQDRFDQGAQVGALACDSIPGGVLIDLPHQAFAERVALTRKLIDDGAPAIFEASFLADNTFVAVDVLTRQDNGFHLTEVKSSSSQKEQHLPDAAVQVHVLQKSGIRITGVDVMHLNKECHFPLQCHEPYKCPFMERCWPKNPDHIMRLFSIGPKKGCDFLLTGVNRIADLSPKQKLSATQKRQIRAMKEGRIVVEPGLRKALEGFEGRLGFLDFETIQRAVPVWPGMAPWEQAPAQFSYHEANGDGTYRHAQYLAEGSHDARPELARAMVEATKGAERVATYSHFEKTKIQGLQRSVPELRPELEALEHKLIDLLPVIRDNVYHPDFLGSFSLKYVLTPLVPELTYDDLVIVDGLVASVEIARLLFVAQKISPEERDRVRQDLLNYCERDTWAMVKVLEKLRELAT